MRVLVLLIAALVACSVAKSFSGQFANCALLSESKAIRLHWTVAGDKINFALEGTSAGYLSFGLSETGGMMATDAYLISINNNATDKCYSGSATGGCWADVYIPNYSLDWSDAQSLTDVKVGKDGTQMWGTGSRKLATGDTKFDYEIKNEAKYKVNFAASDNAFNWGGPGDYHRTYGASSAKVNFFTASTCAGITPAASTTGSAPPPAPATTGAKPVAPTPAATTGAKPVTPAAATTGAKAAPTPASSTGPKPFPVPEPSIGENTIKSMGFLLAGQKLWAPAKKYYLSNEQDGNLVIFQNASTPIPIMATGTSGKGPCIFVIQGDGNLVMYGGIDKHQWKSVWASGSYGKGTQPYYMSMLDDRLSLVDSKNATIYEAKFTVLGANFGGAAEDGTYALDDPFAVSSAAAGVVSVALLIIAAMF